MCNTSGCYQRLLVFGISQRTTFHMLYILCHHPILLIIISGFMFQHERACSSPLSPSHFFAVPSIYTLCVSVAFLAFISSFSNRRCIYAWFVPRTFPFAKVRTVFYCDRAKTRGIVVIRNRPTNSKTDGVISVQRESLLYTSKLIFFKAEWQRRCTRASPNPVVTSYSSNTPSLCYTVFVYMEYYLPPLSFHPATSEYRHRVSVAGKDTASSPSLVTMSFWKVRSSLIYADTAGYMR